jgi:hypothetical protein
MAILRRILKYTPAVVLGLLVVAWVVSCFFFFGAGSLRVPFSLAGADSTVRIVCSNVFPSGLEGVVVERKQPIESSARSILGCLNYRSRWPEVISVQLPYPLLVTAVIPFAIGPYIRFRFRLWHYLAYTTLVAVELAYYLRWHL